MAAELIMILVVDGRFPHTFSAFLESIRQLLIGSHLHIGRFPQRSRALGKVRRILHRKTHFGIYGFLVVSGFSGLLVLIEIAALSFFLKTISRGPVRIRQSSQQTRPIVQIPLFLVAAGVVIRWRGVAMKNIPVVGTIASVYR